MKKLIMILTALAMVAIFMPNAEAADSAQLGIQVNFAESENNKPVLKHIGNKVIRAGKTLRFEVTANDPDMDTLNMVAEPLPKGAIFRPCNGSDISGKAVYEFIWTPARNHRGNHRIKFTVTDGKLSDKEKITISVR